MSRKERVTLIEKLQALRSDRLCIAYVTSTRGNHEVAMADDVVRLIYDHLEAGRTKAQSGVDLLIHSNGGQGTVPWRIVSLVREYTDKFAVLVPHRAFSAATLLAMGADEIIMHKMGMLGPIDPSVANPFNPPNPQAAGQMLPISVEDVTAYFRLVQDEIGIRHEDELVQALLALTEKIHPLALGNVQRSHQQARMMARKLLKQHMTAEQEHEIDQLIDNLKSNLFYHGHPINRKEAKDDLKLKVVKAPDDLAGAMWTLYEAYESALKFQESFQPLHELELHSSAPVGAAPPTTQQIVQQMTELAQAGVGIPAVTAQQLVELAAAMIPHVTGTQAPMTKLKVEKIGGAYIESIYRTDVFLTDMKLERAMMNTAVGPQEVVKQEITWQRWESEK
jgi:hypothetical protein